MFHLLSNRAWAGLVLAVLVITRWPIAPKYLYYFDSVNFALALDRFDPALHQPQPPGYPLFVAFTRLIHTIVRNERDVFLIAGILAAWAAVLLCKQAASDMFSPKAGAAAALLLVFNPVLWLGGVTNQVRVFLAAGSTAVLLTAWRALEPGSAVRWFYLSAGLLGVAAGFRPTILLFLIPLLVLVGIRSRRSAIEWLIACGIGAACVLVWLCPTIVASGGVDRYWTLIHTYANDQFRGSSLLFGSGQHSAWRMAKAAIVWNGIGVITWIWAVRVRRDWRPGSRTLFLTTAFLPAFLFHALVHVGDPDHVLVTVPMLCMAGGAFLVRVNPKIALLAPALNVLLFLSPPNGLARAAGYPAVAFVDHATRQAFDAIERERAAGPIVLISYDAPITWRHLSYYFRTVPLYVLHSDHTAWRIENRQARDVQWRNGAIEIPAGARRVWVLPSQKEGVQPTSSPYVFRDASAGTPVVVGGFRFQESHL